jgi:hypothetical protein
VTFYGALKARDGGLPLRLNQILPSSGLLRGVSGLFIGPKTSVANHLSPRNNPEVGRILV